MKQRAGITADDGSVKVKVDIRVETRKYALTEEELDRCTKDILRNFAGGLTEIVFTNFGIENTKVTTNGRQ